MSNAQRMGQLILLLLAFLTASAGAAEPPVYSWGATEKGLRIGLAMTNGDTVVGSSSEILIAFENTSKNNVVIKKYKSFPGGSNMILNLGKIWNNGAITVLNAVTLLVTEPDGTIQRFDESNSAITGGDPAKFLVILPAGATYQLRWPLPLFDVWTNFRPDTVFAGRIGKTVYNLPSGSYKLSVEFKGEKSVDLLKGESDNQASYDFWLGSAQSGTIPLTIKKGT